jgi:hypothetical protein
VVQVCWCGRDDDKCVNGALADVIVSKLYFLAAGVENPNARDVLRTPKGKNRKIKENTYLCLMKSRTLNGKKSINNGEASEEIERVQILLAALRKSSDKNGLNYNHVKKYHIMPFNEAIKRYATECCAPFCEPIELSAVEETDIISSEDTEPLIT